MDEQVTNISFGTRLKRYVKAIFSCVLFLGAMVGVVLLFLLPKSNQDNYFVIDQAGTVYVSDFSDATKLREGVDSFHSLNFMVEDIVKSESSIGIQMDEKEEFIYYPIEEDGNGVFDLYQYSLEENSAPILIERDVIYYDATKEDCIVYQKSDSSIYVRKGESTQRVTASAISFWVDEKGKYLVFADTDIEGAKTLHYVDTNLSKAEEVWEFPVDEILYVSDDLETIIVKSKNEFIMIDSFKKSNVIAENVIDYYGYNAEKQSFYYITDDQYLYYFDGKESKAIYEKQASVVTFNEDVLVFQVLQTLYVAKEDTIARVDIDNVSWVMETNIKIDKENEAIYLWDNYSGQKELFKIFYTSTKLGMVELIDTQVEQIGVITLNECYYIKNGSYQGSSYVGDLFCKGECLVEDIAILEVKAAQNSDVIYFYKDYKVSTGMATLMKYENGKTSEVMSDVLDYYVYDEKNIMMIVQMQDNSKTLYHYSGKKIKEVLENITFFFWTELQNNL